ncbi:MAG: efflux transporter, family, subunit [Proteobacteria bacterium]|nr:efflux transporter, family, subunit [Pseudomonadota bacterium]
MSAITRSKPRATTRALVFVGVIAVLGGIGYGVFSWKMSRVYAAIAAASYERPPIEVATLTVTAEHLPRAIETFGTLQAVQQVDIATETAGRVIEIDFSAGQQVKAGEGLVHLDDSVEQAQRAAATASARFARLQFDRSQKLDASGAEPRQTSQQRQAELDQADAEVTRLDAVIAQKTVRAPFSGQIGLRQVNIGQIVSAGTVLATLTALDELHVNFAVPQQQIEQVKVRGKVSLRTDAYPGRAFTGTITAIAPVIDAETRNVSVQATLQNQDGLLRPGLFMTVGIDLPPRDNVVLLPITAVQTSAFGDNVYLVREGKVDIAPLTTGQRIGDRVVIEQGLSAGDVVITSGQLRVYPGAAVAAVPSSQVQR